MAAPRVDRLAEALASLGWLTPAQLAEALREQARTGIGLGRTVVERGWVGDADYANLASQITGVPRLRVCDEVVDPEVAAQMSDTWIRAHQVLPMSIDPEEGSVRLAVVDPQHLEHVRAAGRRYRRRPDPRVSTQQEFKRLLGAAFGSARKIAGARSEVSEAGRERAGLSRLLQESCAEASALEAVLDLCVERGLVTREEFAARLRACEDGSDAPK